MNKLKMLWCLLLLTPFGFTFAQELPEGYKLGEIVANFTLKNIDGSMLELERYRGSKGVVVIFTCNHCPYSQAYEQRIIDFNQKYSPQGYPVIAINPNDPNIEPSDSYAAMVERAGEKAYTFPYLIDEGGAVAMAFGARRTPHVFLLKKTEEGFKLVYVGAIDDNTEDAGAAKNKYVEMAIANLESDQEVEISSTKAIGCTIKWGKVAEASKSEPAKVETTKAKSPTKRKSSKSKK